MKPHFLLRNFVHTFGCLKKHVFDLFRQFLPSLQVATLCLNTQLRFFEQWPVKKWGHVVSLDDCTSFSVVAGGVGFEFS